MASNFDALRLAGLLEHEANEHGKTDYKHKAAVELRRQHSRIEELESELMEQCRINGMGAERELAKIARIEADEALMPMLLDALEDITSGWKYIRSMHGDLYGVGWDRAQDKADAAITALRKRLESSK